jgi:hypothetical protein
VTEHEGFPTPGERAGALQKIYFPEVQPLVDATELKRNAVATYMNGYRGDLEKDQPRLRHLAGLLDDFAAANMNAMGAVLQRIKTRAKP